MDGAPAVHNEPSAANRWVLVTGGSRGVGGAVSGELAARHWNLIIAYLRNDAAAEEVAERVRASGQRVLLHKGNLASAQEYQALVGRIEGEVGRLDGLVHCAGLGALSPATATRGPRWRIAWDTHVGALVELVTRGRHLFRVPAAVVAVTSLGARRVLPGYASIGAAKGSLETIVRYLAAELAPTGINVNAVCGGPLDTDSLRSFPQYAELESESRRRPPGRMGRPADLAPVIGFLLGPDARWIRGQVIVADGGFDLY